MYHFTRLGTWTMNFLSENYYLLLFEFQSETFDAKQQCEDQACLCIGAARTHHIMMANALSPRCAAMQLCTAKMQLRKHSITSLYVHFTTHFRSFHNAFSQKRSIGVSFILRISTVLLVFSWRKCLSLTIQMPFQATKVYVFKVLVFITGILWIVYECGRPYIVTRNAEQFIEMCQTFVS